jgi:hypothetical protein
VIATLWARTSGWLAAAGPLWSLGPPPGGRGGVPALPVPARGL